MASRAIYEGATADAAASVSAVEGAAGPGAGCLFYPSPLSGGAMPIGFHGHEVASADSGDLFCNHLFEMLDVLAVEVGADPLDEFHFAQGAIRFNDGALGVDPLRLDSIQPRTLDRQSADQDSYSAF